MRARRFVFTLLTAIWLIPCFSQVNPEILQTRKQLDMHRSDTTGIRLLYQLSRKYTASETFNEDSALFYIGKALELTRILNTDYLLFEIYTQYSNILEINGNYSIAMQYLFNYLEILDNGPKSGKRFTG